MKAKQHFGVRRMPVPGKLCWRYVTRHFRSAAVARTELREFLMDLYARDEKQVKKAMSLITGRGLGELEMFTLCDLFEEWWAKEKRKRAGATKNWKKALEAKPLWNKQDQKRYQAWLASRSR
jgi:hypothetical protein